ncbi:hypothetical protein DAPPUDRAFT_332857 [Daphnia pulex]|uniref:Major facilitator superfamily (MFS) profile domain-containing protein n=1 Tax=Daphnia pulex TaxID=6669 RepID=E9HR48_DAPPU|nr:hypothetical protein DAPPUDRAFT_332857 [Daphnia pulex]|eukprot:EFX65785.1 hypothetical protein DAPPUDRAFT_332857 [Daphnia pulex]
MESDKRDVRSQSDEAFDADVILEHLGNTGWFQFRYFICLAYAVLFPMATILAFNFTGATPAHRCFVDGCDDDVSPQYMADWMDQILIQDLQFDPKHWQCEFPNLAILPECAVNITVNDACSRWIFDKSIFSSTIVTDFLLVCKNSWKPTFVSSLTMVGIMAGAFFLGPLPDIIGRRKSVLILSVWMSVSGIALSFSTSYEEFAVLRFINGMGCIALMQSLAIWGVEAMAPNVRVRFIFIIFCFQSLGNLLTGLLAYYVRDWATLQLYLFVPMVVTISYFFILPESTRWLTVNKRYEEAKEIYKLAAELNGKKIPPHLLLIPVACSPAIEQIPLAQTGTCSSSGNREDASAWMSIWHVFKTPCLLKRLLILFCAWASALLCYYGLSYTASNLSKDIHLNFILVILVEIPAYLIGMVAVDTLGRRLIINITLILGGIFCLLAGLVPQDRYELIVTFSLIGKFFISMQIVTVNMLTAEVFPTASRGLTIGLCSTVGKVGGILAPVMSAMGAKNRSLPYIVFGCINLVVGALSLMLPETKGLPIPATIQDAKDLESKTLDLSGCRRKSPPKCRLVFNTTYKSI